MVKLKKEYIHAWHMILESMLSKVYDSRNCQFLDLFLKKETYIVYQNDLSKIKEIFSK